MKRQHTEKKSKPIHINLPQALAQTIEEEAAKQYRTTASLIRQTLAEKFKRVGCNQQ